MATVTYPNGVQSLVNYDDAEPAYELTTQQTGYNYQLGPRAIVTSALESSGRQVNWSYDGIYRLTNEAISSDPAKIMASVSLWAGSGRQPTVGRPLRCPECPPAPSVSTPTTSFSTESYDDNGNTLSQRRQDVHLRLGEPV